MAEVQRNTQSGELTQQFIQLVSLLAQQASSCLGLVPDPRGGEPEVNLDYARLFIDQLSMLQEKTRGNLSTEEAGILRNAVSNLQMAYVEVSGGRGPQPATRAEVAPGAPSAPPAAERSVEPSPLASAPSSQPSGPSTVHAPSVSGTEPAPEDRESKKRFTKSYGS